MCSRSRQQLFKHLTSCWSPRQQNRRQGQRNWLLKMPQPRGNGRPQHAPYAQPIARWAQQRCPLLHAMHSLHQNPRQESSAGSSNHTPHKPAHLSCRSHSSTPLGSSHQTAVKTPPCPYPLHTAATSHNTPAAQLSGTFAHCGCITLRPGQQPPCGPHPPCQAGGLGAGRRGPSPRPARSLAPRRGQRRAGGRGTCRWRLRRRAPP